MLCNSPVLMLWLISVRLYDFMLLFDEVLLLSGTFAKSHWRPVLQLIFSGSFLSYTALTLNIVTVPIFVLFPSTVSSPVSLI